MKKHWYKDMHYAEFAEDESQALLTAIKEYENNKWKTIGQKVGKPAKVRATRTGVQLRAAANLVPCRLASSMRRNTFPVSSSYFFLHACSR